VSDGDGHGTWVAAAAAGNHANDSYDGMAPDASLVIGKVLADDGSGTTTDIVDALHWACEVQNADVVSMSLGGLAYSSTLAEAVEECAREHNTTIVIATGNAGITQPVGIASPADTRGDDAQSDGIIAVSATNVSNASTAGPAYFAQGGVDPGTDFSNGRTAGAMPTVTAPGTAITAPTPTEDGSVAYSTLSGTSMSTPIVSGAVALSMEGTGGQNGTVAEQRVAHSAAPVQHGGATEVGAGMVDVGALLQTPYENVSDGSYYADQRDAQTDVATARDRAHLSVGDGLFDQLADESVFGTGALLPALEVAG
jgi:subtilisin family serine protease